MNRRRWRAPYPLLIFTAVVCLTFLDSLSASAYQHLLMTAPAARLAPLTPTPVPTPGSVPGSTDGIMWMGIVIVLIILIPLLLSRGTWPKS
jgi:hypothetical protein